MVAARSGQISMWLAIGEGAKITWADFSGYYTPAFYWSAELRGSRVVECTYEPTRLIGHEGVN
jgi:hypothetical protein